MYTDFIAHKSGRPYYEAAWKRYVDAERAQRAIGRVLKREPEDDIERIVAEDRRRTREGRVPFMRYGRICFKHIDDLTREDVAARLEAERTTITWLKGA